MSESKNRKPASDKEVAQVKKETVRKPTEVTLVNRTNQKQVIAIDGETYEFLASGQVVLPFSKAKASEKFALYISKNILSIIN